MTLADDSGLEVDALNSRPGVLSARYARPDRTDAERVQALLEELRDVPDERRTARFLCVIADPKGALELVEGSVEGRIAREPRGENGFGLRPGLPATRARRDDGGAAARREARDQPARGRGAQCKDGTGEMAS